MSDQLVRLIALVRDPKVLLIKFNHRSVVL